MESTTSTLSSSLSCCCCNCCCSCSSSSTSSSSLSSLSSSSKIPVTLIEESGQLGLYMIHNQNLELIDLHAPSVQHQQQQQQPIDGKRANLTSFRSPGSIFSSFSSFSPTSNNQFSSNTNAKATSTSYTNISPSPSSTTCLIIRRYELNPKLFAIQEPYLMRTEREALVRIINEEEEEEQKKKKNKKNDDSDATEIPENGKQQQSHAVIRKITTTLTNNNRSRRRKRTIAKKGNYIEQNLCSDIERKLASKLIDDCLDLNINNNRNEQITNNDNSNNNDDKLNNNNKQKMNLQIRKGNTLNSSTSSSTAGISYVDQINTDRHNQHSHRHFLRQHINTVESYSNAEAQMFVQELFKNRFESLNYRGKLFCNPYGKVIKVKFGLSNYLIPARCSFAGVDIVEGINRLIEELKQSGISGDIIQDDEIQEPRYNNKNYQGINIEGHRRPFFVIMDPAWENRSVKRKKTYETVTLDYLRRMCRELKILLDLVIDIKMRSLNNNNNIHHHQQRQHSSTSDSIDTTSNEDYHHRPSSSSLSQPPPLIIIAIWATKADKDFVIKEMLPTLGLTLGYELKWHKVCC